MGCAAPSGVAAGGTLNPAEKESGSMTAARARSTACAAVAILTAAVPACAQAAEVNVYTYREHKLIQPLLDTFSKQTGIDVNVI
jgi:spermidine/putrescine-binding protein